MKGIVENVSQSTTGKSWRVRLSGRYYGAKFDTKLDEAVGKHIDFTVQSDPKFGDWVTSWMYDKAPPTTPDVPQTAPYGAAPTDRYWLNFVSNCVGQAIAHGTIKEPAQIKPWAVAAYRAITSAGSWTPQQPDDDINF